jgi:hypothetical protein
MLKRARFEALGRDHPLVPLRSHPLQDDGSRPSDISGEIGNAHASLSADHPPFHLDDHRIEQHDQSVRCRDLRMGGDVDRDSAPSDTDLWRSKADACRRRPHRVDQIARELFVEVLPHFQRALLQHSRRDAQDWERGHDLEQVGFERVDADLYLQLARQLLEALPSGFR